jgi:hypothetical protein
MRRALVSFAIAGTLTGALFPGAGHAAAQATISFEHEPVDSLAVVPLREYVREGRQRIEAFFGRPFAESFVLRVLPTREAYDRHAAEKWGMSETACWMVGGAENEGVILVSPRLWTPECDHDPSDAMHVRDLVVHELVHVYHMQNNPSNEFEGADEVGWFVEGLATYASGQLEHGHAARAREAVETGAVPERLADAWSGPYRYGVSGSLVAFVDERVGRAGLVELLGATTQTEILDRLGMTESELLAAWAAWVRGG